MIPLAFAWLFMGSFPIENAIPAQASKKDWKYGYLMRMVGSWFFMLWIIFQPGFADLISHLFSSEALWDWRLIVAVFIWCLNLSYSNYRKANELEDLDILAIYDDTEREGILQQK